MCRTTFLFIGLLHVFSSFSQDLSGVWQGMLISPTNDYDKADVLYMEINLNGTEVTGNSRMELVNRSEFSIKQFTGNKKGETLILEEKYITSSSNTRNDPKCKLNFELTYEEETGYLKGKYESSDCRRVSGSVLLYRSKMSFNQEKEPTATHLWKALLARDYKKGYPSPEIRELERQNFNFQPIFFDHDKSEIKPEFYDYLNKIARVLDGHSDLRVRVTGHTDAVGTDAYNIGLSERRAKAIVEYFLTQGIKEDKLEFDFKGKRMPAATNETSEGKQRNRRVDFEFI
jgi:outer membrane protein OmpA-like peptidoglycan-associated protein